MRDRNYELERQLNKVGGTNNYTNMIVATANMRGFKVTEDWIRRHLIGNVEDGIMTYGEALVANEVYIKLLPIINS